MIVDGKIMEDNNSLASYNVSSGKEVKLSIQMGVSQFLQSNVKWKKFW